MGCYMSRPNDEVHVTEGKGRNFTYATASCQGWRRDQEDAEACIPDFDENASLFILCDGHGGAEVAKYTVEHFPAFLKEHKLYKKGDYRKALKQAFIEFDATLRTPAVMKELTKLAFGDDEESKPNQEGETDPTKPGCSSSKPEASGSSSGPSTAGGSSSGPSTAGGSSSAGPSTSNGASISSVAEDVDVETLRLEAQVPIEELVRKYADRDITNRIRKFSQAIGISPAVKSKNHDGAELEATSSTNDGGDQNKPSSSKPSKVGCDEDEEDEQDEDYQPPVPETKSVRILNEISEAVLSMFESKGNKNGEDEDEEEEEDDEDDEDEDEEDDDDDDSDADGDEDGDDECDDDTSGEKSKSKKLLNKKQRRPVTHWDRSESSSEEDSEDDDSDDDSSNGWEDDEDDEQIDDSDDYEDIEEDEKLKGAAEVDEWHRKRPLKNSKPSKVHRPVMDSGCTVVVGLLKDDQLYVANAGDSRLITVLNDKDTRHVGHYEQMTLDHKPEDPLEYKRICLAGGQVVEGRVNGGLNLSRAFGDFTYKNSRLLPHRQMITADPDITMTYLDTVDFIFLACDGIWNSLNSQHVADYIRSGDRDKKDLVEICMELFKVCLAPSTDGDGTGCDNMTCILVKLDRSSKQKSSTTNLSDLKASAKNNDDSCSDSSSDESKASVPQGSTKRSAEETGDNNKKRRCLRLLEGSNLARGPSRVRGRF